MDNRNKTRKPAEHIEHRDDPAADRAAPRPYFPASQAALDRLRDLALLRHLRAQPKTAS